MDRSDALILAGAAAITAGLYLVYMPLALIFGGSVLSALGFAIASAPARTGGPEILRHGDSEGTGR